MIQHGFRYKLYLDDLPGSITTRNIDLEPVQDYQEGVKIGTYNSTTRNITIANHLVFTIRAHNAEGSNEQRIVGFDVEARSIAEGYHDKVMRKYDNRIPTQVLVPGEPVTFSYSIFTINDERTEWAHRMDHYWRMGNSKVHFLQLFISLAIVTVATLIISQILRCALNKDIRILELGNIARNKMRSEKVKQRQSAGDDHEVAGLTNSQKPKQIVEAENVAWKKIQGDVLRTPEYPNIFCCMLGMGAQIAIMTYITLTYLVIFFARV